MAPLAAAYRWRAWTLGANRHNQLQGIDAKKANKKRRTGTPIPTASATSFMVIILPELCWFSNPSSLFLTRLLKEIGYAVHPSNLLICQRVAYQFCGNKYVLQTLASIYTTTTTNLCFAWFPLRRSLWGFPGQYNHLAHGLIPSIFLYSIHCPLVCYIIFAEGMQHLLRVYRK